MIRIIIIFGLFFSYCGLLVDKSVKLEIVDLKDYSDSNVRILNSQITNDSDLIFATIEIGYTATHSESFYGLINKKDNKKVLKFDSKKGVFAYRLEQNELVLTDEFWNDKDKWVYIDIENSTTHYKWDSIPPRFENFNKIGIYQLINNEMIKQTDMNKTGLYFISAFSTGTIKRYNLQELKKMYWH